MTFHLTKKLSSRKKLSSALVFAALATTGSALPGFVLPARADVVTPAQWLARQPKPVFKPGHTLPRLTRFGWDLSYETHKVLAEDWNYVLQTNYLSDETVARLDDPNSREAKMAALTLSNPARYPFGVILDRSEPPSPAPETFLRDGAGNLLNGQQTYSPLNPQSVIDQMAELRARPLRNLRARLPISMILNGGEYGLGVIGDTNYFEWDPTVAAAKNQSGDDWFNFISKAKAREMNTIADAVRVAVPDRNLYIYYHSGNVERFRYWGWTNWSYDNSYALNSSDLPSNEIYYKHFNSGYLDVGDNNDMLTRALNASGFQIANGKKLSYDWLSNGWINENGGTNPPPVYNPAAIVDPNAGQLGSDSIYTGLLKCLFTAGMIGGNAGYYEFPAGGFDDPFEASRPKYYLTQMTALSQVQALFSYLESDVRGSDLLGGPNMHAKSGHQPAYEFPTGSAGSRVLARKVTGADKWIITAWAADGVDRTVRVSIPGLGNIALSARAAGSVYIATIVNNQMQLMLTDSNGLTPTVGGYAPVNVTEAPPNPTNAFANGGFETPVLSGGATAYVTNPTGAGWSFVSTGGIQRNGSDQGAAPAPEGSQTAFVGGGIVSMGQVVSLSAGTYKLQFQMARRWGETQPIQITVDGVNLGSPISPTSDGFAVYESAEFTVTTANHEIKMVTTNPAGHVAAFIDDVRIVVVAPAANANFANGGFENPVLSGGGGAYVYNPTGAGWNFASGSGIQRNGSAWGAANAPEGSQTAFLQGAPGGLGEISQVLNLIAGSYKVQFKAARRGGQQQPIQIKIGGVNLGSLITPGGDGFATYDSAIFTAPGGNATISLSATDGSGDKSSLIDDVLVLLSAPPVPSVPDDSQFISQVVPSAMDAGSTYAVSVTMKNTGSDTWTNGGPWLLGTQNPQDNTLWTGGIRPATVGAVAPGQTYTFTFNVTAPATAGTYNFQWRMVHDGVTWFGPQSDNVAVTVSTPAMLVSGSGTLADGSGVYNYGTVNVNTPLSHIFTINNAGAAKLTLTGSPYAVISGTNAANFSVTLQPAATVAAGGSATFTVRFTPSAAGTRTATVSIASNDAATSPYTFNVTGSGLAVPAAPSTLAATRPTTSTRQINLTWRDNSGNESGFRIERATNSTFTTGLVQVATTAANVISFSNTGLAANTRYYYRVRATNAAGNSAYSNVVNALTGA